MTIVCNPSSFCESERVEHDALTRRILSTRPDLAEDADGLTLTFSADLDLQRDVSAWVDGERRCCPFASFTLTANPASFEVRIRGPAGTKGVFRAVLEEHGIG